MTDIVILCPIPVEFWAVHRRLHKPQEREYTRHKLSYYAGSVPGMEGPRTVALLETGSKIEDLKSVAVKVIDALKPRYLLLTGVAGGVKDVALGDVVVATKAYGYESGKETEGGFLPRPDVVNHPKEILDLCRRLEKKHYHEQQPYQVVFGPIASGNKVLTYSNSETVRIIKQYYSDTIAVEMEAIGFAKAAAEAGIPFANIRGISDLLDNKSESDKSGSQEIAADRAAEFAIELIRLLPLARMQGEVTERFEVRYLKDRAAFAGFRRPEKGELRFKRDHIEFRTGDKIIDLKEIRKVEHLAMPGDLAPNWVMVEYKDGANWSAIFLSTANPVGFGYWFGGSKQLFKNIEPYKVPEYRTVYEIKNTL